MFIPNPAITTYEMMIHLQVNSLKKLFNIVHHTQKMISVLLLLLVTFLVFAQVILRYCLKMPLMGIEELLMLPTIWLYMISAANASLERNHIECGIATLYIKTPKAMCLFKTIRNTLSAIIGFWLLKWAFWFLQYTCKTEKESALLFIPMKYIECSIFVGFFLMWFYTMLELIENLIHLYHKDYSTYLEDKE